MKIQPEENIDPSNDAFTAEELKEIEAICRKSPAVKKLADRYALMFSEPHKSFYAALAFAAKQIENHILNGTLNTENKKQKSLMDVLKDGGTYYKTLQVGKEKSGSPEKEDEIQGAVKDESEKKIGGVAERYAKDRKL